MSSKIRVVVRVRPPLSIEKAHQCTSLVLDPRAKRVRLGKDAAKDFQFDQVFEPTTTQSELYERTGVASMIASVLDGFHATIFAYGQTGSGKTFSMEGYEYEKTASRPTERVNARPKVDVSSDRLGIVPRVILGIYNAVASADKIREYTIRCSFVQIYNEQILDLLNPSLGAATKSLRLRWAATHEFYVENLITITCTSADEMLSKFQDGVKHKIMASHNLNAASSRSHCIYTLYVESVDTTNPEDVVKAKLSLVDLAGSERVVKTGATGVTLQESIGINKSLFVLRQVIQTLSDEAKDGGDTKHVPYRDSKLTALLKHSLGGNSITLMIACLSPSDVYMDENLSTLVYAARAQSIANKPTKNEDPKTLLIQQLRDEVAQLKAQLAHAHDVIMQLGGKDERVLGSMSSQRQSDQEGTAALPTTTRHKTSDNNECDPRLEPAAPLAKPGKLLAQPSRNNNQEKDSAVTLSPSSTKANEAQATVETTKLQLHVIDNVSLIKTMFQNERTLRLALEKAQGDVGAQTAEVRALNLENRALRERMEVLEYLALGADDGVSLARPSQDRIDNVLTERAASSTLPPPSLATTSKPATVDAKPTHETGVLSISELRHLLSGKPKSSDAPAQRNRATRRVHSAADIPTRPSLLEQDPTETLSELNRLLRAKATLKAASSRPTPL
ncbi:hypothetical protein SDRG_09181 [Saprolegnia diclina VS20]|uniref:Kinesin-like protein n=1 Tax=Saprolegnia diclina (strain VS20) TaxID=1156394 RepID=T0RSM8_SAPDV|nr:hypothetical protein SDRG_09181 [Saprolegnia diclina VS20]EQC33197.1 hypothetical protein SDRG_09181 [Saprolegnia diclina VS20]|eukprot:XP_008613320.1 hypothetical protein SDRG_09181 [Saprolegnia diclina VS20]